MIRHNKRHLLVLLITLYGVSQSFESQATIFTLPTYDYGLMLTLMEQHHDLTTQYYANFKTIMKNSSNYEKNIERVLSKLTQEKSRFYAYLKKVKIKHKKEIRHSPKTERKLQFYMKSLLNAINDMKKLKGMLSKNITYSLAIRGIHPSRYINFYDSSKIVSLLKS